MDDIRSVIVVDPGPVEDAALTLIGMSTLSSHVTIHAREASDIRQVTRIELREGDPFETWGSGTQGLWRLLSAIAHSSETVSLYEVVSHLDAQNRYAVAIAVGELCGEELYR